MIHERRPANPTQMAPSRGEYRAAKYASFLIGNIAGQAASFPLSSQSG